jgi:hypothetical protein
MRTTLQRFLAACLLGAAGLLADDASPTRWSLDAGWGVRLWDNGNLSKSERNYLEQARVGGAYALDVSVFPWKTWGFGLVHARFTASASDSDMAFPDESRGEARDHYVITYTAPSAQVTRAYGEKLRLVGGAGAGVLTYRDEAEKGAFPGILEGTTWGLHAAGSVDVLLSRRFAVGFGVRALYGRLSEFRYNAIETTMPALSLSRVDFGVGLRYYP